jgi:hypothetical protein
MAMTKEGDCSHCGECCKGNPRHIAEAMLPAGSPELAEYTKTGNDGYCYFYDVTAQRCRIYAVRPWFCKDWPSTPDELQRVPECGLKLVEYIPASRPTEAPPRDAASRVKTQEALSLLAQGASNRIDYPTQATQEYHVRVQAAVATLAELLPSAVNPPAPPAPDTPPAGQ